MLELLSHLDRKEKQIEKWLPKQEIDRPEDPIEIERCLEARRSLLEFFRQCWQVLEPGTELEINWHVELICEYLELVAEGTINRLLINIAPRHLKSRIVSVAFPCWLWLQKPTEKFLCLSYGSSLANDLNDDRRKIIQSEWYQSLSGGMKLSGSKNRISEFENSDRGTMVSRGLEAGITGQGAGILLFDDPNDPDKVESGDIRDRTTKRFKDYSGTRRNDPRSGAVVVIQQRTHDDDVTGYILKKHPEYTQLCLPTEAEDDVDIVFPKSRRVIHRSAGELLHPDRFGSVQNEEAKRTLGSYMYAARHAQRPVPIEGGIIKTNWMRSYSVRPAIIPMLVQVWDTASKAGETNAYWVCGTWGILEGSYYLLDVFRKRMDYVEGKRMAISLATRDRPNAIVIEDKSTGQSLIQELNQGLSIDGQKQWFNIVAVKPESDKITRMSVEAPAIEAGRVYLPNEAPWLPDFISEVTTFPFASTADQVDMLSMFLRWAKANPIQVYEEFELGSDREAYSAIEGW